MQVYSGMDIGTAKPGPEERLTVTHHLLDVVSPAEPFSVADYVRLAESAIAAARARGALPLVVGGTGFYLRALARGLPTVPMADPEAQAPLWRAVELGHLADLAAELRAASPADAERAGANPRRVVRSVEVLRRTGLAPSAFPLARPRFAYRMLVLLPATVTLGPRIEARTADMFGRGLVAEVRALLARYPDQPTALQAIGYKEVAEHLRGHLSLEAAHQAVTGATLRYAKRQRTWFKAEPDAQFVPKVGEASQEEIGQWWEKLS